ncbi:MAG TPA: tyrosine-type recombinase/integrase [Planctomycetota bacterium]|nr:tyrosine-type recombinase/integrase [Planctomycetota bacterium]
MNLQEAIASFEVQLRADGRSEHTVKQYGRHLRAFSKTVDGPFEAITPATVAAFMNGVDARTRPDGAPKRATSVNALRSSLRTFFAYANAAGWTPTNPARLLRRARTGTPPPRAMTDADRDRMLATLAAGEGPLARRDEMLVRLLLGAGLRIGSALGVDVGDVDLDRGELAVRTAKGDRPDTVFLSSDLVLRLRRFIGERRDGPLFTTERGTRLTARQAARRFAALGIPGSLHTLRHTFATGLLAKTGDLALVQAALRHRSIASTIVYAKATDVRVRRAIDA